LGLPKHKTDDRSCCEHNLAAFAFPHTGGQCSAIARFAAQVWFYQWLSCRDHWNRTDPGGILVYMTDVTQILSQIEQGDPNAAEQLLPLVYDELRKLAAAKLANEKPGLTLQATALVHEAYLRLVDVDKVQNWDSRRHFFSAAAESMRRILVERARRKRRLKHGGEHERMPLDDLELASSASQLDLLALDEALSALADEAPEKAEVVRLRFFAGLGHEEVAGILGVSTITVKRHWRYARAWLLRQMAESGDLPG
jgi:RNA polymerase sigma factor (TIGR02999 family)